MFSGSVYGLQAAEHLQHSPISPLSRERGSPTEVFSGSVYDLQAAEYLQHPPISPLSLQGEG